MSYRIKGTYLLNCNCRLLCPCPIDGKPTGPNDECRGVVVFHVAEGQLDDTGLSGVSFVWYNLFPSNISAGMWKVQFVVDDKASDEQANAIERIVTGQEGGIFTDFAPLVAEVRETRRAPITFTTGDKPSAVIGEESAVAFEPAIGPDGTPAMSRAVSIAPEFKIGRGAGETAGPFGAFEHVYGETAEFDFSSPPAGART